MAENQIASVVPPGVAESRASSKPKTRLLDLALLMLVNLMWAGQYRAYKVASKQMGPVTPSLWAFLVAGILLLLAGFGR